MTHRLSFQEGGRALKRGPGAAAPESGGENYRCEALEALDALLAGPLGGGLSGRDLEAQFPVIRAALRQIRSDLEQAWPREAGR